ncbi:MAG: hypothetical protein R3Y11_05330, partial [Pseudomonadota bacterium]
PQTPHPFQRLLFATEALPSCANLRRMGRAFLILGMSSLDKEVWKDGKDSASLCGFDCPNGWIGRAFLLVSLPPIPFKDFYLRRKLSLRVPIYGAWGELFYF